MTREEIKTVVLTHFREVVAGAGSRDIPDDLSMRDVGADSLEIVEVVARSMKELKIRVPRTELATAENIGDLVDLFERALPPAGR